MAFEGRESEPVWRFIYHRRAWGTALRRSAAIVALVSVWALALALPPFWGTLERHYKPPKGSALAKAQCGVCHTGPNQTKRNLYGKEIERLIDASPDKTLTPAILTRAEGKDSDGDGTSNGDEIRAGSLPGDPKSRPTPTSSQPRRAAPPAPQAPPPAELIPRHSFHPLAVHFPVALFLFGGFLDFLGKLRKSDELRRVAVWNLGFGALSGVVAVPTGIAAWLRLGFALEGNMLIHFALGIASTLLMLALAALRRKAPLDSKAYWGLLAFVCITVAAAGHYGALLVYG